jgi:hypothetical protein
MRIRARYWGAGAFLALAAALVLLMALPSSAASGAQHVRWDIFTLVGGAPPGPINPGGPASATAPDGDTITLTGSGHFVAPASGGGSGAADGGGTYTTSGGQSGTYSVTALLSWENAGAQANVGFIDNIDEGTRTNGTAVLAIKFSDGSSGVLTLACHGPGAPPGIFEGIATTKGYKTYYTAHEPEGEFGRTIFHVH